MAPSIEGHDRNEIPRRARSLNSAKWALIDFRNTMVQPSCRGVASVNDHKDRMTTSAILESILSRDTSACARHVASTEHPTPEQQVFRRDR